jgi:HAD superfamily hydrolase (TIGR01549 family)
MNKIVIKAIVWDLDGTIVDFKIDWIRARKEVIKFLKSQGVPKEILTINSSILDNIRMARKYFENSSYDSLNIENIIREVDKLVSDIEYEAAIQATAVKGIENVLEFVKQKNLKQAIYTYNTYKNANVSLEKTGLIKYFDLIVGRDGVKNAKPHPDHLLAICSKLNLTPSEILVIGDTHRDIEGALNVGAKSIGIKTKISQISNIEILEKANKVIEENEISSKLINAINELL